MFLTIHAMQQLHSMHLLIFSNYVKQTLNWQDTKELWIEFCLTFTERNRDFD